MCGCLISEVFLHKTYNSRLIMTKSHTNSN